jgi:hypothetical protein
MIAGGARALHVLPLLALLASASCPGSSGSSGAADRTAPVTTAHPGGGTYGAVQYVTLAAEEAATIHYSLEGAPLPPGHPSTVSAENPVYWIRIGPGTTTLRFFSVDRAGNREATRTETYVIEVPAP